MRSRQTQRKLNVRIGKRARIQYLLYLPKGYRTEAGLWPVLLFLHGAGERGNSLAKVKKHGPPKLIEQGCDLPFIVVSPQCPANEWWQPDILAALLDEVLARHNADPSRVYLTGLSMGGRGVWTLAIERPERFAAIAPICGWGEPFAAFRLKDMPTWIFHGARDSVVPAQRSREMYKALCEAGNRQVKLTVYRRAEHDSWTATYENPALYEWMLQHRRRSKGPRRKVATREP